jgi:hypothetical protein
MAKRVTVSIPDLLHEKMEQWRESFNLSKMFQEAVADAIQKKEDFQRRLREDREMGEIIERLKKEKARSERNCFDRGRDDGFTWARSAEYDDLIYGLNWKGQDNVLRDRALGPYFFERAVKNGLVDEQDGTPNEAYLRVYVDGWKKGLAEFWDAIKDKL